MLRYARHVPRSEEIVMAPATAQLVQLTISSELARKQNIPVPDMVPAVEVSGIHLGLHSHLVNLGSAI